MEKKSELISVQLNIAGKMYPVKLTKNEKHIASEIALEINQKINDFQLKYKEVDRNDAITMIMLTYAFDYHKLNESKNYQIDKKLKIIEKLVDSQLD